MNIIDRVKNLFVPPTQVQNKKPKRISDNTFEVNVSRLRQEISTWRSALDSAEDKQHPDRFDLYDLYKEIAEDGQVLTGVQTIKDNLVLSDFSVYVGEEPNEDVREVFEQKWFSDFLEAVVDSRFWGAEVIQIDEIYPLQISTIEHEFLAPEVDAIKKMATGGVSSGNLVPYVGTEYEPYTLPIYKKKTDLGLFNAIAPYFLWKKVIGAWAEYADRFGMPFRIVKTDLHDTQRVAYVLDMLEKQSGSSYGVFDINDTYEAQSVTNNAKSVYKDLIDYCDKQIIQIILRQTGTTDEKSFAGSANVHQMTLETSIKALKKYTGYVINGKLIPMLTNLGVLPVGVSFYWDTADNITTTEKVNIIKTLTDAGYKIPAEYVEKWTGVEIEHMEIEMPEIEEKQETTAVLEVEDYTPGTLRRKSLEMGVSMLTVMKDGVAVPRAYKFDPKIYNKTAVEDYLKQHGIKAKDVWHVQ